MCKQTKNELAAPMQSLQAWTGIAGGLIAGIRSALSVLADNVVESSLAISDICHHIRVEARSMAKAPYWARLKIHPMPISQANQILDVGPHEDISKARAQRDKLLRQLTPSPFLQVKVNEAYKCLEKSKLKRR